MATSSDPRRIILWFRNDLRLRDNVIIHEAVQKVQAGEYSEVSAADLHSSPRLHIQVKVPVDTAVLAAGPSCVLLRPSLFRAESLGPDQDWSPQGCLPAVVCVCPLLLPAAAGQWSAGVSGAPGGPDCLCAPGLC
jgi:hypothetical protein